MFYKISAFTASFFVTTIWLFSERTSALSKTEKKQLRDEVKEMFYHAYNSYMDHAYPADELMPLSCKGRFRGTEPSRGDVDDILGNFSLTLVDSFDTLVVLGDIEEFDHTVKLIIRDVHFDRDIVVSVFETNIRMLGGLLSGHVLADMLYRRGDGLSWYRGELLDMAKDLGYRLLPAFNTTTGIPYPRVNLRHGVKQVTARTGHEKDTCTACAGTMLLEFAALSRLTDEPIFEAKAHKAMDSLWQYRHRTSNLVGTVINIHNGEWVRRDSGIGAGIDSYYEYLLKAYILLGDDTYLDRFNKHYESIMRYINQGPLMVDVHMHRPTSNSKNFMDSLFAFWPGLQVLKGDLKPAVEIHEMLYQVMQRHNFLPEAFTTDFRVHWAQHPLRPEFIESTYFLYRATGDPHYLEVGKKVVENLNKHARVDCGYAAIKDVTTGKHENQMDSFFLSETFKYLYLLFAEDEDLILDIDDFIFTTEAHLLPLTLSLHQQSNKNISVSDSAVFYTRSVSDGEFGDEEDYSHTCPNSAHLYRIPDINTNYAQMFRNPLRNMVESVCPKPTGKKRSRLKASQFMAGNKEQIQQLQAMGIRIITMNDGRVQLLHTASEAASPEDAEDGMQFMQEMIELSKIQSDQAQQETRTVQILSQPHFGNLHFPAGPAQFGLDLTQLPGVTAQVVVADPIRCCSSLSNSDAIFGKIVVVERGSCMFIDKARVLEASGALAAIVIDGAVGSSAATSPLFAMSGDGKNDVELPMVFLFHKEGSSLLTELEKNPDLEVYIGKTPQDPNTVLKSYIVEKARESVASVQDDDTMSLRDRMSVTVRRFDVLEDKDEPGVRLTFHDVENRALFRIVQRPDDHKLEFQFEKNALDLITKKKMSSLIEKVVGLIQANINFGTMDLTQQSDYLFSLGKLMEASVNENSESRLEDRVRHILHEDLNLQYDEIMAAVTQQDVQSQGTTNLLRENINQLLDTYIEEQLNQVYNEAEAFLHQLSQGSSESEESSNTDTTEPSFLDQELDEQQSTAKGPENQNQPKKYSTKKIRFETRDGKVRQASWLDMSQVTPSGKEQAHYIKQEELQDAYHKMSDAKAGKFKPGGGNQQHQGTKIHRPPEWMILQDDEIFVDAEGLIYANFGWEENDHEVKKEATTDDSKQSDVEVSSEGQEKINEGEGHDKRVQGVVDEEVLKHSVHSLENEIKYGIVETADEYVPKVKDKEKDQREVVTGDRKSEGEQQDGREKNAEVKEEKQKGEQCKDGHDQVVEEKKAAVKNYNVEMQENIEVIDRRKETVNEKMKKQMDREDDTEDFDSDEEDVWEVEELLDGDLNTEEKTNVPIDDTESRSKNGDIEEDYGTQEVNSRVNENIEELESSEAVQDKVSSHVEMPVTEELPVLDCDTKQGKKVPSPDDFEGIYSEPKRNKNTKKLFDTAVLDSLLQSLEDAVEEKLNDKISDENVNGGNKDNMESLLEVLSDLQDENKDDEL